MIALLMVLLFGSTSTIGNKPMHLGAGEHQFHLRKPISAVNSRAHLEINVSAMLAHSELHSHAVASEAVEKRFPRDCLKATLHGQGPAAVRLELSGHTWGNGQVFLRLGKPGAVPTWQKFDLLKLSSCTPLNKVTLHWMNAEL